MTLQYHSDRLLWNDHTVSVADKMPRDKTPEQTTIWDYQSQIWPWAAHNFGDERVLEPIIAAVGLSEEVGELHRAMLKDRQGIRGTHEEWTAEQKKELGDVFIKVIEVGARLGFDMEQVLYERWQSIKQRDWRADAIGHGIGQEEGA